MWKKSKISSKPKSSRSKLIAKLDKEVSLFIRHRDSNNGAFRCISCGRTLPYSQADCGHYINRQHMAVRFSEMNCNAQCRHCNRFMEGNIQGYRRGLVEKYGENKVLLLESKQFETAKFTEFELQALTKHYHEINKQNEL